MVSVPARRAGVAYATGKGLSQRRACTLLGVGRSALHYCSTKLTKDTPVLARMAELSARYPRYGYRRIAIFLGRDGHAMSFGRAHRLWRQARLQVPRKRPRKRVATGRPRPNAPTGANQVWSYDFVFDWCARSAASAARAPRLTNGSGKQQLHSGTRRDRTSRPEPPAIARIPNRPACSGKRPVSLVDTAWTNTSRPHHG
jgi:hypothetical protein